MPLPNFGYDNQEKKTHQDIVFEMAPEIVSDDDETVIVNGKKVKRVRGKVTTGKIGIDLERTLKINQEQDPNVWKTDVDPKDIEEAKKFSNPERKVLKADVRKGISSLISASMARNIRDTRRPTLSSPAPPSAETQKNLRFSLPDSCKQKEECVMAVSIQPSGSYPRHGQRSGSISSSSPRSTPDPTEVNITRRVDPRYQQQQPVRHSLSQAFHEKNGRKLDNGDYSMSEMTVQRSVKSLISRGIN